MDLPIIAAFLTGLATFISPCILPIIPGFLAYLAGSSLNEKKPARLRIFLNSLVYVLGFSTVFSLVGVLLSSALIAAGATIEIWLGRIGGIVIVAFGLSVMGIFRLPFLQKEHRISLSKLKTGYLTSFIFGAAFAVGWSPCIGPVLGATLTLAATRPEMAFLLLMVYTIGLGIPFLLVGLFTTEAIVIIRRYQKFMKYFHIVVGGLLVLLGILVFFGSLNMIANLDMAFSLLG
ncbi:MAG: cytochrome c biogenesis protein CcdA [archaeon]